MMAAMADFLGGLLPTFFFSRLLLWLAERRGWRKTYLVVVIANGVSALICFAIGSFLSDSPSFGSIYLLPQTVWLLFDVVRLVWYRVREISNWTVPGN
jgi:hypothetical protein